MLLFAVYEHAQENDDHGLNQLWEKNEFMGMFHDMLDQQLRLCIEPFNKINGDGVTTDLLENFLQMVNMFSLGRKQNCA